MFGFFLGAACLGGLAALLVHRSRHHHGHGYGGRHMMCAGGGRRRGFGPRWLFNAILDRLDTTPGQEKVIVQAIDELQDQASELHAKLRGSRGEVANALRSDVFDDLAVEQLIARHAQDWELLGHGLTATLKRIHEALDPDQRRRLARMIESGPRWGLA